MSSANDDATTIALLEDGGARVRRFRLRGASGGFDGKTFESTGPRCAIGSHASNDLVVDDRAVSKFHCEVALDRGVAEIADLGSRNGTFVEGVQITRAILRDGLAIRVGRTTLEFELTPEHNRLAAPARPSFGAMVGRSALMQATIAALERAASSDATVVLEGETGTGKSAAAEAIHSQSRRASGPLVAVDCGAIPPALLESELFGHEKGAFTGAVERRRGVFEAAHGGSLFLDEIGELPFELQPKLLRAIEAREIRPVGSDTARPIDVRIIAATNRDLRAEVNAKRFREDLFYRLAVIRIRLPALRERLDDLPDLVLALLRELGAGESATERLVRPGVLERLRGSPWPGNVRELRNHLERCLVFEGPSPLADPGAIASPVALDESIYDKPFPAARKLALEAFERAYMVRLLERVPDSVMGAAQRAGINRVYLYRILRKHGLQR